MSLRTCYIGFGSNLGDRTANCRRALESIRRAPGTRIIAVSSLYESEPVCSNGPWFFNGVAEIRTSVSPRELLRICQGIESRMGRIRPSKAMSGGPAQPRTLDLDILLCGDEVMDTPDLVIPHPRMHERKFVLTPLAEIAPSVNHPGLKKNARALLENLKQPHQVRKIMPAHLLHPMSPEPSLGAPIRNEDA